VIPLRPRGPFASLLVLWAVSAATFAADIPAQLTLSEAIKIALSNSTVIREAVAQLEQTSGQYRQARSALLPQLDLFARQSIQTLNLQGFGIDLPGVSEPGLIGPFGSMDARLLLNQDIFNLATVRAWKSYRSRQDASRILITDAREIVTLNVVSTYLQALRAKASRDTLVQQIALANELYKVTRERVTAGVSAELDANRAMQKVNTLEQQWQQASQSYIAAKLALANILQARITSDFEVADDTAYGSGVPIDRDAAVKTALSTRADYRAAQAEVRAAEWNVQSIKATRLPTFGMFFSDGQSGITPVRNVNTYRLQGAISMSIFNGGRIRGEIEEAEGALNQARILVDRNRSQIETDVRTSISALEWALKEVETSTRNVRLSRQEVEFTRSRFSQGVADNTEVVNAQDRLTQADDAHIRALYSLGLARANFARATGAAEATYRK
jgi:outer membrane protein TolC